jgi:hypothetical protein
MDHALHLVDGPSAAGEAVCNLCGRGRWASSREILSHLNVTAMALTRRTRLLGPGALDFTCELPARVTANLALRAGHLNVLALRRRAD